MPTIMPSVSRSRASWRSSLRATAVTRRSEPTRRAPALMRRLRRRSRAARRGAGRRTRPRVSPTPAPPSRRPGPRSARSWTSAGAAALAARSVRREEHVDRVAELGRARHQRARVQRRDGGVGGIDVELHRPAGERARQSGRLADGDPPAVAQHAEAVTAHGLVHVVRRDEDRRAAAREAEELLPELAPALRVDAGGRLVEHEQLGVVDGRGGEREPLLPPARERPGPRAAVGDEPGVVEHRREPGAPATPPEPEDLGREVEVLLDREILVEREVLGHVADRGAQALGVARHAVAEHLRRAGGRLEEPHQHAHERRLARSVRAEAAEDLAPLHREVDPVDRDARAEAAREPARHDRDRGRVGGHEAPSATSTSAGWPGRSDGGASAISTRVS